MQVLARVVQAYPATQSNHGTLLNRHTRSRTDFNMLSQQISVPTVLVDQAGARQGEDGHHGYSATDVTRVQVMTRA